jgi:NAD(P)-dependent dehydrogenase (short-subunit alcohol dehydrogenase family)
MDLQLTNKTAFISGSTSGIGFAIAKALLAEGAVVIINGRSQKNIDSAVKQLQAFVPNGKVSGIAVDFKNPAAMDSIKQKIDQLDILINNLGIYVSKSFDETTTNEWQEMLEINLMSSVNLSKYFLPKMKAQNWGRIIFISSECAQLVPEDLIAYSTTKAAIQALSRGLAQTTIGSNVSVNTLAPGSTLTESAQEYIKNQANIENRSEKDVADDFFKKVRTTSLLQRFTQPKEIADMAVFLASPLSSATNGAVIKVDGGSIPGIV